MSLFAMADIATQRAVAWLNAVLYGCTGKNNDTILEVNPIYSTFAP